MFSSLYKGVSFMRLTMIIMVVVLLTGCHWIDKPKSAKTVDMYNTTGDMVGTAKLSEDPDGVVIELKLEGLTPGFHGVHIHEVAKCEGPDFKSAGNHFNPKDKEHGLMNPDGSHLGDLPNVEADQDGKINNELTAKGVTLLKGNTSLIEQDGTSLIVTSEADDGMTQISGNAGERIICGEIKGNKDEVDKEKTFDHTEMKKRSSGHGSLL